MKYKTPFLPMQAALFRVLQDTTSIDFFDSGVSPEEIEDYYKEQSEVLYGVLGASTADAESNKDTVIWSVTIDVEIYSNYKGRKTVADALEKLMNAMCKTSAWNKLNEQLNSKDFVLTSITMNDLRINLPVHGEAGVWHSGATSIKFLLTQVRSD